MLVSAIGCNPMRPVTAKISAGGYLRGDKALAEYVGVCLRTAINLRRGGFPHYRIGRGVFFKAAEVDRYLEERCRRGAS
jgi:excisionase family DNA binding protein